MTAEKEAQTALPAHLIPETSFSPFVMSKLKPRLYHLHTRTAIKYEIRVNPKQLHSVYLRYASAFNTSFTLFTRPVGGVTSAHLVLMLVLYLAALAEARAPLLARHFRGRICRGFFLTVGPCLAFSVRKERKITVMYN